MKSDLIKLLGGLPKAASSEHLWELLKDNPKVRSKRHMKMMLQQLKLSGVARAERLDTKHFGYRLSRQAGKEWERRAEQHTTPAVPEVVEEPAPKSFWS